MPAARPGSARSLGDRPQVGCGVGRFRGQELNVSVRSLMRSNGCLARAGLVLSVLVLLGASALAQTPAPREASWIARDFTFHTGEVAPELSLHYTTLGDPAGEPVLILHGTTGSGSGLLSPGFGGELFGPGQPLDAAKYFI